MRRVEAKGLGIYGIKPLDEGGYSDYTNYERTLFMCTLLRWYWNTFNVLYTKSAQKNRSLQCSASYYIPELITAAMQNTSADVFGQ